MSDSDQSSSFSRIDSADESRAPSVHTAAALAAVDGPRDRSAPSTRRRSVHYASPPVDVDPRPPSRSSASRPQSTARSATAASATAALAGVLPTGGDRLKHLQLHMEQLQQLYAQEIHKEELAAREAFAQSLCTAGITLWRYVCSRPRFYTAVRALVTQYLPAADARLYQVEQTARSGSGWTLALADGRAVAVGGVGIVSHAVLAAASVPPPKPIAVDNVEDDTSFAASGSSASSTVSDARTPTRWLDRFEDCVMPSADDHLLLLLPLDRADVRAAWDPEIDLPVKKRQRHSSQLLVLVLRDADHRPVGAIEALVASQDPVELDFLDAFSRLLAAALAARRSICRPVVGEEDAVRIEIVHSGDAETKQNPVSPTLELDIAPEVKMVVTGGGPHAVHAENDLPLLHAAQQSLADLWARTQMWTQKAEFYERRTLAEQALWSEVVAAVSGGGPRGRWALRRAISEVADGLEGRVCVRVLFDSESLDEFTSIYAAEAPNEVAALSVEGQFAALERAVGSGERVESTPWIVAVPVHSLSSGRVGNAAVLVMVQDVDDELVVAYARNQIPSIVAKALALALCVEAATQERGEMEGQAASRGAALEQAMLQARESHVLVDLGHQLAACRSRDEIARRVDQFDWTNDGISMAIGATLFVADYQAVTTEAEATNHSDGHTLRSIWTVCGREPERVVVLDQAHLTSGQTSGRSGGMAAFVLESGEALRYTPQHAAYDVEARQKFQHRERGGGTAAADLFYYAVPVRAGGASRSLAVLEFAFASEASQRAFQESSCGKRIASLVGVFMDLHLWVSANEENHARVRSTMETETAATWTRWTAFVAAWGPLGTRRELDTATWKSETVALVRTLFVTATHVHLCVSCGLDDNEESDDRSVIRRVQREVGESSGRSSPTLNVLSNTLLRTVVTCSIEVESPGDVLLVFATSDELDAADGSPFRELADQLGRLVAPLLIVQLKRLLVQQRTTAEIQSLRALVADRETTLAATEADQWRLRQQLARQRVVLSVDSIAGARVEGASREDVVTSILRVITENTGSACESSTPIDACVAVASDAGVGDWTAWRCVHGVCTAVQLSPRAVEWVPKQSRPVASFEAPFTHTQQALFGKVWGSDVEPFEGRDVAQLCVAPLDRAGETMLLVAFLGEGTAADAQFVSALARSVGRVLLWNERERQNLQLLVDRNTMETTCETAAVLHEATAKLHDHAMAAWRKVLGRLWSLDPSATTVKPGVEAAEDDEWISWIETHVREQLSLSPALDRGGGNAWSVRAAMQRDGGGEAVAHLIRDWLRPPEVVRFLEQPRRQHQQTQIADAVLDSCGSVAEGTVVVRWTLNARSEGEVVAGAVAVHVESPALFQGGTSGIEDQVVRTIVGGVELLVAVQHVLVLHRRIQHGDTNAAQQSAELQAVITTAQTLAARAERRRVVDGLLTRVMDLAIDGDVSALHDALCKALKDVEEYWLWVVDSTGTKMWTTQHDGTKRVKTRDVAAAPSPNVVEIVVDATVVAVLERNKDAGCDAAEQARIAAALQSVLTRVKLVHDMAAVHKSSLSTSARYEASRARDEREVEERVRHHQRVGELLRAPREGPQQVATWARRLEALEQEMLGSIPAFTAVRVAAVNVDSARRQITSVVASDPSASADAFLPVVVSLNLCTSLNKRGVLCVVESASKDDTGEIGRMVDALFPSLRGDTAASVYLAAALVHGAPSVASVALQSFAIVVALAKPPSDAESIHASVCHAVEMDATLLAAAIGSWRLHEADRQRAVEAEMALVAANEAHAVAQQWIEFSQSIDDHAKRLVEAALVETVRSGGVDSSDGFRLVAPPAEAFIQTACGCDGVELYVVVHDAMDTDTDELHRLVPLATRGASLSPTSRSRDFVNELNELELHPLSVQVTSSGSRVVCSIRDPQDQCVVGVLAIDWTREATPPDASLEIVNAVVRPWLGVAFSIVRQRENQRVAHGALSLHVDGLSQDKTALELQGLELKGHLAQLEQRNASLQSVLQATSELFQRVHDVVTRLATASGSDGVWQSLAKEVAAVEGVEGVQLREAGETNTVVTSVTLSTLSNADDEALQRELDQTATTSGGGGMLLRCLESGSPQDVRIALRGDCRRVRAVRLRCAGPLYLLIVCSGTMNLQQSSTIDRFVDLCVVMTASRVAELDKMDLQVEAANALEASTQELATQLQQATSELASEKEKRERLTALYATLREDLLGHEVWRCIDKASQASHNAISTSKLTSMWRFLQDAAQRRLGHALPLTTGLSVQLYGVVHESSGRGAFVFSLPSAAKGDAAPRTSKGFYCVALSELQQRREWRSMAKCITKAIARESGSRTMLLPIALYPTPEAPSDEAGDAQDDDSSEGSTPRVVVGVVAIKHKNEGLGLVQENGEDSNVVGVLQAFANAFAPRVDWIGRLVHKKQQQQQQQQQQRGNQHEPQLQVGPAVEGTHAKWTDHQNEFVRLGLQSSEAVAAMSTGRATSSERVGSGGHDDRREFGYQTAVDENDESPRYATAAPVSTLHARCNQLNHGNDRDDDDDVDSEDERAAERQRDRLRIAVASAVLDFALRVQSLSVVCSRDAVASLRTMVARDLKSVWTKHGDSRKKSIDACELFFLVDGVVRDRLDDASLAVPSVSTAPTWLVSIVCSLDASQLGGGCRLFKADASHWVACLSADSPPSSQAPSVVTLLALVGFPTLSTVLDAVDVRVHVPALLRAVHLHVARIHEFDGLVTQQDGLRVSQDEERHQEATSLRRHCEAVACRAQREAELSAAMLLLLESPDERTLIQTALRKMQSWLDCRDVAFHAAVASADGGGVAAQRIVRGESDGRATRQVVALETVLRARVVSPPRPAEADANDVGEWIGTMVARLTESERLALNSDPEGDDSGNAWLMGLLQRLADVVGIAWVRLHERQRLLHQESQLVTACTAAKTLHQQFDELQDRNDRFETQVAELELQVQETRAVETQHAALQQQFHQLRDNGEANERTKRAMATKLKQYETQLIQVNAQLEQSIRAETQLLRLEEAHAATEAREARLDKKLLKQKLQLKQLMAELTARRDKDERDQAELVELRRQVAVLTEKQHHVGQIDAASVASAVMQAQAQAFEHRRSLVEVKQEQQQRVQSVVQRRFFRQLQLQQAQQKRKQFDLAQELKQLAALEVQEIQRRGHDGDGDGGGRVDQWPRPVRRVQQKRIVEVAKVHDLGGEASARSGSRATSRGDVNVATPGSSVPPGQQPSKLRPPSVAVGRQQGSASVAGRSEKNCLA